MRQLCDCAPLALFFYSPPRPDSSILFFLCNLPCLEEPITDHTIGPHWVMNGGFMSSFSSELSLVRALCGQSLSSCLVSHSRGPHCAKWSLPATSTVTSVNRMGYTDVSKQKRGDLIRSEMDPHIWFKFFFFITVQLVTNNQDWANSSVWMWTILQSWLCLKCAPTSSYH